MIATALTKDQQYWNYEVEGQSQGVFFDLGYENAFVMSNTNISNIPVSFDWDSSFIAPSIVENINNNDIWIWSIQPQFFTDI